ncbi:Sodium/calcium exchanger protein [Ceratobasidium sp. AG-Ba]|nr:Sodium/calcium exchanger protein [Ceratobasidium sp. AG-Ba]
MASPRESSDEYAPLRLTSPPLSPPPHGDHSRSRSRTPVFPEPQPMSQASMDEMQRTEQAELTAHAQTHPITGSTSPRADDSNGRAHVRPASHTHRRTGSAPDPWSPGYQRNTTRFSIPSSAGHKRAPSLPTSGPRRVASGLKARVTPVYAHHRQGSDDPNAALRIRRKRPGLSSFWRKLMGERVKERRHKIPSLWESLKAIVTSSWLNILFVFVPISWVAALAKWNYVYSFILAFIAIIPLENISEFGGEQLALYCGESVGDLIVVTLHNVVEAVLAIVLLIKCELKLLQSTVIGVVLLHCLLVPGTAFLTEGTKLWAQQLKPQVTQLNQSLITVGVLALVVPAAFFSALPYQNPSVYAPQFINRTAVTAANTATGARLLKRAPVDYVTHKASAHAMEVAASVIAVDDLTRDWMLRLSRGISVILLIIYIGSRFYLHNPPGEHIVVETVHVHDDEESHFHPHEKHSVLYDERASRDSLKKRAYSTGDDSDREQLIQHIEAEHGAKESIDEIVPEEHHEPPEIGPWVAVVLLIIVIGLLSVTAEWLVKSIEPIRETELFTSEWFGLILLPLVSFAGDALNTTMFYIRSNLLAQHVKPPTDLAKAKSIDLSIQFTLFWIPTFVLIAWGLNEPLTLLFDHYEVVVVVGASFLVNSVTQDGRTNWSEGMIMVGFYIIIALGAWYYPGDSSAHFMMYCRSIQQLLSSSPAQAATGPK